MKECIIAAESDMNALTNMIIRNQENSDSIYGKLKCNKKPIPSLREIYKQARRPRRSHSIAPSPALRLQQGESTPAKQASPPSPPSDPLPSNFSGWLKLEGEKVALRESKPSNHAHSQFRTASLPALAKHLPEQKPKARRAPLPKQPECIIRIPYSLAEAELEDSDSEKFNSMLGISKVAKMKPNFAEPKSCNTTEEYFCVLQA